MVFREVAQRLLKRRGVSRKGKRHKSCLIFWLKFHNFSLGDKIDIFWWILSQIEDVGLGYGNCAAQEGPQGIGHEDGIGDKSG